MMHCGQKFAHQHIESAIAAERNHLARAIQRLYPVSLTKSCAHGPVVEGTDNPLRSTLPDPVAGPERIETGVEGEYRIGLGQIADRSGDRLRMDAILASRRIRLRV